MNLESKNDSINVNFKNKKWFLGKTFLKVIHKETNTTAYIDFKKPVNARILRFSAKEIDTTAIKKNYDFKLYYGSSSLIGYDTLYNYALPFKKGNKYKILQGNNSSYSHNKIHSKYAIDLKMDEGQEVYAMRDGMVIKTKTNSNIGGSDLKFYNDANYILIAHKDNTFSEYVHLKYARAVVKKGDIVKKGQHIGYSGNTGWSTEPHLHFVVFKATKDGLESIPFLLNNKSSKKYRKGNYIKN